MVSEHIEITTGTKRDGPSEEVWSLQGRNELREKGVSIPAGEFGKDLDLPASTAVGFEFCMKSGFLDDFEGVGGTCTRVSCCVVN